MKLVDREYDVASNLQSLQSECANAANSMSDLYLRFIERRINRKDVASELSEMVEKLDDLFILAKAISVKSKLKVVEEG